MNARCALEVPHYRADLLVEMGKMKDGHCVASVNGHGCGATAYYFYTMRHIGEDVTVFYVNFGKPGRRDISEFIIDTEKIINTFNVRVSVTLQDGLGKVNK